jgi:hypothetical protein
MSERSGAQISGKSFIQSLMILSLLMMLAGVLTRVLPAGAYETYFLDGRELINPNSFQYIDQPDFPVWRWFTAPIEVLGSGHGLSIIVIILFIFYRRQVFCYPGPQRYIKEQHPGYCLAFWRAKICFAPDYFAFAGLLDERSS